MQQQNDPRSAAYTKVLNRIIGKIASKGQPRKCAMCGVTAWTVGQYVTLQAANHALGPAVPWVPPYGSHTANYPCVAVYCSNCGNTHLVNLLVLGFTEQELQSLTLPRLP